MPNFDINSHYIKEANFSQVKFGEDGYVLEVELNELQQIQRNKLKEITKESLGSFGIFCEGEYDFDQTSLRIKNERVVIDGEIITIEEAYISELTEGSKVYLQAWESEVNCNDLLTKYGYEGGEEISNKIKDARVGVETSRRYLTKYTLSSTFNNSRTNLLIGTVSNGKFISSLKSVGDSPVMHTSTNGKPISILNLGGCLFSKPQLSEYANFNFLSSEVEQDGLVESIEMQGLGQNYSTNRINVSNNSEFYVETQAIFDNTNSTQWFIDVRDNNKGLILIKNTGDTTWTLDVYGEDKNEYPVFSHRVDKNRKYTIGLMKIKKRVLVYLDGMIIFDKIISPNLTENSPRIGFGHISSQCKFYSGHIYNRALIPQEIQHNLQILNNSPSIRGYEITDTDARKKEFLVSTQSDLVTMSNGYNAEECATGLLATMGQEFVSADGTPIVINNAVDKSKILSCEIKGQTVKQIIDYNNFTAMYGTYENGIFTSNVSSPNNSTRIDFASSLIQPNSTYYVSFDVKPSKAIRARIRVGKGDSSTYTMTPNVWNKVSDIVTTPSLIENIIRYYFDDSGLIVSGDTLEIKNFICIETTLGKDFLNNAITSQLPFGLSSTQAIINVDNEKYPFLCPTIEGDTWVENGVLKSLEPSDNTLPKLGKWDSIDRATREMIIGAVDDILDGTQAISNIDKLANTTRFSIEIPTTTTIDSEAIGVGLETLISYSTDTPHIYCGNKRVWLFISNTDISSKTPQQYLKDNPIPIRYQLATSQKRILTTEEFKAYSQHEKVISLHGIGNNSDSIIQSLTGEAVWNRRIESLLLSKLNWSTLGTSTAGQVYFSSNAVANGADTNYGTNYICSGYKTGQSSGTTIETATPNTLYFTKSSSLGSNRLVLGISGVSDIDDFKQRVEHIEMMYLLDASIITTIDKRATPTIPLSGREINNCLVEVGVDSPVLPSEFSFIHYPTVKSVVNELTMEQLFTLGELTQPFHHFDYAETGLNACHHGYMSGGFINIPFHLLPNAYVNYTNSVVMYDDLTVVLINSTSKEITIPKTTENVSIINQDGHNFILRVPTVEEGVGNIYVISKTSLGIGLIRGNENV